MFRQSLLLIIVTCAVLAIAGCSKSTAAPLAENASDKRAADSNNTADGDSGVILERLADGSTTIGARPDVTSGLRGNELFFSSDSRVIKVGSVYAKGQSIQALNSLLTGPANSSVEITFVQGDQELNRKLNRYTYTQLHDDDRNSFNRLFTIDSLFTGKVDPAQLSLIANNDHLIGNDFAAAPYFITLVKPPKFKLPQLIGGAGTLADAVEFFASVAMFEQLKTTALTCVERSTEKTIINSDADSLTSGATAIAKYGFQNEARATYENLYRSISSFAMPSKLRIMRGRVSLMPVDGSKISRDACEELSNYCLHSRVTLPDTAVMNETLQQLVDDCIKRKFFDIALSAQNQLVSSEENGKGWVRFLLFQDRVASLVKLSKIYELSGNSSKSEDALQKALAVYSDKLNLQEQILLERVGSRCKSDLLLRLAQLYASNADYEKAEAQVSVAERAVSDALGPNNQACIAIGKLKKKLTSQQADTERQQILHEFADLIASDDQYRKDADTQKQNNFKFSKQLYDAMSSKNTEAAISILDKIFAQELSKTTHTADNTMRLINLVRLIESPSTRHQAITYLKRLDVLFDLPEGARSTNQIFQKAEVILLSEESADATDSNNADWSKLETILRELDFHNRHSGRFDSGDFDRNRFMRLARVSYVYAFFNEPQKALRILHHALNKVPTILERDASPIAYEAILHTLSSNMKAAQKQIDVLVEINKTAESARSNIFFDYSKMVVALAATLYQTGHSDLSLRVLEGNANLVRSHSEINLAYCRAYVEYKLGRYSEALAALNEDHGTNVSVVETSNYTYLKAQTLAKLGRSNDAILVLLKVFHDGHIRLEAFEQAISIAHQSPSLPQDVANAIIDATLQMQWIPKDKAAIENMQFIIRLAKQNNAPNQKVNDLTNRLSFGQSINSDADQAITDTRKHAESFETENKPNANYEWANLARLYFAHQKYSEGTAAMIHAIQMPAKNSFNNGMYHPGNLRADLGFDLLLKAKRYDDAEKILMQCLETNRANAKKNNWGEPTIELSFLAELFIEQGKYETAKKWADELLASFSRGYGVCPPRGGSMRAYMFYSLVDLFTTRKQFSIAQQLLDDATTVQLSQLGLRNALFIENYVSRAKLLESQNKLPDAENFATKALDLENWVDGSRNAGRISRPLLASILRAENKMSEADRVATVPSLRENRVDNLEALYNIHVTHSHMRLPNRYANTAEEPLKTMLDEANETHGEGSTTALKALDNLITFYVQQSRYDQAERLQLHELKILDLQYGKCVEPKFNCYLNLSEIYLLEGKDAEALKFAQQISEPPEDDQPHGSDELANTALRFANVLFSVGNKERALEIAKKVESSLLQTKIRTGWGWGGQGRTYEERLNDCLHFMERAGAVADANALRTKMLELPHRQSPR
ncbi:hypothetical protein BH10CYA1_BH10CYA1_61990 [soil metagenome]